MSLVCRVELNKKDGVTIEVIDEEGKISQTIHLDGKQLLLTVKDENNTSIISQKPDSIKISCKTFSIEADDISTDSKNKTVINSKGTYSTSADGKITINGKNDFTLEAINAITFKGLTIQGQGTQKIGLTTPILSLKADNSLSLQSLNTDIKSSINTNVSGMMVNVKASTVMNIEGLTTTLKGQLTNVQGTLVKLG